MANKQHLSPNKQHLSPLNNDVEFGAESGGSCCAQNCPTLASEFAWENVNLSRQTSHGTIAWVDGTGFPHLKVAPGGKEPLGLGFVAC